MISNPIISVIMPAYNAEKTISETIRSVLDQTFNDFELIIVNDGSTDGTDQMVKNFNDQRIKLINIENSGPSTARNRGIQESRREFISFIDSDDLWTRDKLEKQYSKLKSEPDCDVAYSWTIFIDESGKYIHPLKPVKYQGDVYEKMLVNNFVGSGSNILVKKTSLESAGYFNTNLKYAEEWDLLIRLSAKYKFAVVKEYHIFYRQNLNSLSSSIEDLEKGSMKVIENAYANVPEELFKLKKNALSCLYEYLAYLYLTRRNDKDWNRYATFKYLNAVKLYPRMLFSFTAISKLVYLIILAIIPEKHAKNITQILFKSLGIFYRNL